MEPDTFLSRDAVQPYRLSYDHLLENQMSFFQKVLYKSSISYKVTTKNVYEKAKLNLITTTPKNFFRMLYRIGPVFDFKCSLEAISFSNNITLFLCILLSYVFLCYYPIFLLYVPFLVILVLFCFQLFLRTIKYKVPGIPIDDPSCSGGIPTLKKALEDGKDVPIKRNLIELQNMMGDFADLVDRLLYSLSYYLVEDTSQIFIKWMVLIISFVFFYLLSVAISTSTLFAIVGTSLMIYSHTWVRCVFRAFVVVSIDCINSKFSSKFIDKTICS